MSEAALLAALDALGVTYTIYQHAAVFTVEESAELHAELLGAHTKNLFLKDASGQFWLVTVPHDARVDLKALPAVIGSKKLSFGKSDDMERLLGVTPGSVTPLAALNDIGGGVRVVIDTRLTNEAIVNVHPLRNTATISLSSDALLRALAHWEHDPLITVVPTIA